MPFIITYLNCFMIVHVHVHVFRTTCMCTVLDLSSVQHVYVHVYVHVYCTH